MFCATAYQAIRLSHINNKPIPMTELQIIQQRTESTIDTNISDLNKLMGETKLNLQLTGPDKAQRIAIIRANINVQVEARRSYNALMTDVKVKF